MNGLDALLTGSQILAANAAAGDTVIDTAITLGPGLLAAATGTAVWRSLRWAADRRRDRATRRAYSARAYRLCRVADRADAYLAMPAGLVNARLEAQLNAVEHAQEEER
ncbi:hypothetical protein K388_05031 [Streptomyces sp. KhCrAH-43]|uniref:hypothetical protein n=1 Tax=unclassified Streptomyces TaxID=2593676 RepID=UPI00039C7745|nr:MULTISPECIES: hypothetical protein [unclassified Streptomyces]MYX67300.1 hypothetical protein [Streptomyces sp. SID8373]RAJ54897.1 hypothetical protein K388_05031 [Streptomyces sp. KhCrAH-43]